MKNTAAALLLLLVLLALAAGPAGAQTPEGGGARRDDSGELAEAARLTKEVTFLFNQNRYDEAAPLAERALAIRLGALGPDHRGVAEAEYNFAMIRVGQGRFEEAEALLRRALAVFERAPAPPAPLHAKVLSGLALVRAKLAHAEEAAGFAEAAAAAAEKALPQGDERLGDYYRQLADVYRLKRDAPKAEQNYLRAIEVWAKAAGRDDARVGMATESLLCTSVSLNRKWDKELWDKIGKVLDTADPERRLILNGKAVEKPQPEYPSAAKGARISGSVVVKVLVDAAGVVRRASPVCGHGLLAPAGVEAARRARFSPTLLDGKPTEVSGYITYTFVLLP